MFCTDGNGRTGMVLSSLVCLKPGSVNEGWQSILSDEARLQFDYYEAPKDWYSVFIDSVFNMVDRWTPHLCHGEVPTSRKRRIDGGIMVGQKTQPVRLGPAFPLRVMDLEGDTWQIMLTRKSSFHWCRSIIMVPKYQECGSHLLDSLVVASFV